MEEDLDVKVINANSPQAKGRVERLFETLQDRLVKELRLAGVSSIPAANRFLDEKYLHKHNQMFNVLPKNKTDMHRPVGKTEAALDAIFSFQEERILCKDYTIHWQNRLFQVEKHQPYFLLPRTKVMVEERLNGEIKIKYKGRYLKMHEIDPTKIRKPAKHQKLVPHPIKGPKTYNKNSIPALNHPWRKDIKCWAQIALMKRTNNLQPIAA